MAEVFGPLATDALAYVPKAQQTMVAAGLRQALLQPDQEGAHRVWRAAGDQFRTRWPKLAAFMDDSEHDVLAFMAFPSSTGLSCAAPTHSNV